MTPQRPRYAAVDFRHRRHTRSGGDQHYLAEKLPRGVRSRLTGASRQLHLQSGWVPPGQREVDEMEVRGVRTVCRNRSSTARSRTSPSDGFLLRLFEISRRFNMQIQPAAHPAAEDRS